MAGPAIMKSDPGYYDHWPYRGRPPLRWPGDARVAFWVAPNIEFYELNPPANPYRKAWPQPYPAIQGYGIRDYGNRVGHWRQMDVLDRYGIRGVRYPCRRPCVITTRRSLNCVPRETGNFSATGSTTHATPTA
jgi:hypothetical protein